MSLAACGTEAEVCMSLPPDTSDFGSGLAFTESALCMGGGGVLGSSVAKSPVSRIDSFPSMGCPGTITLKRERETKKKASIVEIHSKMKMI